MWWFYCHIKEQADCINTSLTAKNSKAGISKMLIWEDKLKLEIHNGNNGGGGAHSEGCEMELPSGFLDDGFGNGSGNHFFLYKSKFFE